MANPASTDVPFHPLLTERYSPRAFLDQTIPSDVLLRIFEAARWSPSCSNEQEWYFIAGCKGQGNTFDRICKVLADGNKRWASNASALVLVCGRTFFEKKGTANNWHAYDCGQAVAHLTFQAAQENIMIHQMAGFDADKVTTEFVLPDKIIPITIFAMGYSGTAELLPPDLAERETAPRVRKQVSDFVFGSEFGKSFF
jgi:nitroreductase